MVRDEVVQFAAGKVGGEVCDPTGDHKAVKIAYGDEYSGWTTYRLSSPDLMLKGLAVYYKDGAPFQISPWGVKLGFQNMTFDTIERIPEMFWQCWYEKEVHVMGEYFDPEINDLGINMRQKADGRYATRWDCEQLKEERDSFKQRCKEFSDANEQNITEREQWKRDAVEMAKLVLVYADDAITRTQASDIIDKAEGKA